jgi:hypothetical protein
MSVGLTSVTLLIIQNSFCALMCTSLIYVLTVRYAGKKI